MRIRSSVLKSIATASILLLIVFSTAAPAAEVTLAWDSHDQTHTDLIGYNLYYKADSSVQADPDGAFMIYIPLSESGFDPDHPSYHVTGLLDDTQYYFVVTAMVDDTESGMSNEVSTSQIDSGNEGNTLESDPVTSASGSSSGGGCFLNALR